MKKHKSSGWILKSAVTLALSVFALILAACSSGYNEQRDTSAPLDPLAELPDVGDVMLNRLVFLAVGAAILAAAILLTKQSRLYNIKH